MKNKKIIKIVTLLSAAILMFSSCGMEASYDLTQDDNVSAQVRIIMSEAEVLSLYGKSVEDVVKDGNTDPAQGVMSVEEIDGAKCLVVTTSGSASLSDIDALNEQVAGDESAVELSNEYFYLLNNSDTENMDIDIDTKEISEEVGKIVKINVTFADEIVSTNGVLSEDKKTVTFSGTSKEKVLYAYTKEPSFGEGSADVDKKYNKNSTVVRFSNCIGYSYKQTSEGYFSEKANCDLHGLSDVIRLTEQGDYEITPYDYTGNALETVNVCIDKVKPIVSGVINNKVYKRSVKVKFSDANGINKAKLNGKSIKSGKKITKKGKYTLTVSDKAGNTKVVKFRIK